ncbi:MAG TPA: peptidylprolyl isomerase [Candidatus Hydrogenedentes bacterium]|mgnify:FL=1|nr:peptidylprolyl isomerase [Candidatus Hydrogenedentota bacterium]HOT49956.1 peptidylprolyl isomerase [Candidatus Hydrogenedentota bacterium]HPC15717.1 peptidylprolyl isomerase [Candidatus Hydrogenedentota bacterium]HRT19659.1 peptidylprolyl isomerase [Candidatus Hydrogenedentota bacterium]HRT64433.1 peptidylprolyl isomerase [Candidatus Hydrogenedentota bacterium]
MKHKVVAIAVAVLILAGVAAWQLILPERLTASTLEKAAQVQKRLDQEMAGKAPAKAQPVETAQAQPTPAPKPADPAKPAEGAKAADPNVFKVKFECSNGNFVVEVHRDWAPLGAERFEQLVKEGFYNEARFFRVVPNFVVQFGLAADPQVSAKWRSQNLKDDPVKQSNTVGTITFATAGPNTRTTQLFINLVDNARLDGMGFAPFGKVIEGMDVVKAITSQYGEMPQQYAIETQGNAYLTAQFPNMDYIKKATIVP